MKLYIENEEMSRSKLKRMIEHFFEYATDHKLRGTSAVVLHGVTITSEIPEIEHLNPDFIPDDLCTFDKPEDCCN